IARKLSEGISIGKSLYVIYYRAVLFGGEQDKEIQPLLGIGRSVEPRHMAPVSHQVVPDAQAVFRQQVTVVAAVPSIFEVIGVVQRIEVLVRRGEYGHTSSFAFTDDGAVFYCQ